MINSGKHPRGKLHPVLLQNSGASSQGGFLMRKGKKRCCPHLQGPQSRCELQLISINLNTENMFCTGMGREFMAQSRGRMKQHCGMCESTGQGPGHSSFPQTQLFLLSLLLFQSCFKTPSNSLMNTATLNALCLVTP